MNMTSYKNLKRNRKKKNIKQKNVIKCAFIQYQLKLRGLTQAQIAKELNISSQAVNRALLGQSKISRVDEWIEENLGLEVVNAL